MIILTVIVIGVFIFYYKKKQTLIAKHNLIEHIISKIVSDTNEPLSNSTYDTIYSSLETLIYKVKQLKKSSGIFTFKQNLEKIENYIHKMSAVFSEDENYNAFKKDLPEILILLLRNLKKSIKNREIIEYIDDYIIRHKLNF